MSHQHYIKDFGMRMHLNLGHGGHMFTYSGIIVCPTLPIHNKEIYKFSHKEKRGAPTVVVWKLADEPTEYTAKEFIDKFDLVSVKKEDVNW